MNAIEGLSHQEVLRLREDFGENVLEAKSGPVWPEILISQFKSPLIYILLVVGLASLFLAQYIDASLVFLVLVANVGMGFYQEYSAQKTLEALKNLLKPTAQVIRDGKKQIIDITQIVPGDFVVLSAGDKVSADGRLIEARKLLINEAILTGEEEAVSKSPTEQIFMGTTVVAGKGTLRVEKIGSLTEVGRIGRGLGEIEETKTPLELRLEDFSKNLAWLILGVCLIIFLIGILLEEEVWEMLRMSIILAIAAMPEALPIAVTVILALGMRRILRRKGLVRKLLSIETLGSTSVICTDKTGTLTEGVMQVVKVDNRNPEQFFLGLALLNEEKTNLEVALAKYVQEKSKITGEKIYKTAKKIDEEPFDSEKKYAAGVFETENQKVTYIQGAPELILSFCRESQKEEVKIIEMIDEWADNGLRILGVASKTNGELAVKKDFKWLGLVGIQDPVRVEAKETLRIAQKAGIKVKIITGDYLKTAEAAAKNLGMEIGPENFIEGPELEIISDRELKNRIEKIILFARVRPHQKFKIVQALQEKGEIVAMTGDGVNDAPALKKADIGVVVGSASEVAKESADLILLDSNFKTIIAACEEGRLILANIKKVVGYILSNSFAEIVLIFMALFLNLPIPLTIVQILWIHLICDGPPDILLGFEPKEAGLMERHPKEIQKEVLLSNSMKFLVFAVSISAGLLSLLLFWYFRNLTGDLDLARTIVFANIGSLSLIYIFAYKNLKKSIFATENFFGNKLLFLGIIYGFALIFLAIYVPFLNKILGTVPLGLEHWILILMSAIFVTFMVESVKFLGRRKIIKI